MFEQPNPTEVEPTTINDANSIQAHGVYRDRINDALPNADGVDELAAVAIRDRAKTADDDDRTVMTDGGRPAHNPDAPLRASRAGRKPYTTRVPAERSTPNRTGSSGGDHSGTANAGEPETVPTRSTQRISTDVSGAIRPAIIASRQGPSVTKVTFENGKARIWYQHTPPLAVDRLLRDHGFTLGASSRRGPYLYRSVEDVADDGSVA